MRSKSILFTFFAVLLASFLFLKFDVNAARLAEYGSVTHELAAQGTVRTCLSAKVGTIPYEGPKYTRTINITLKGTCGSASGCQCVVCNGENANAAAAKKSNEEVCSRKEEEQSCPNSVRAAGKCDDKWSKRQVNSCKRLQGEIGATASVKAGCKPCNIVSKKNVLGATTGTNVLPPGPVDVEVRELAYIHTPYDFTAVGDLPAVTTGEDLGQGEAVVSGDDKSQKLGLVNFFSEVFNTSVEDLKTQCKSISWDPYGRVFDAQSLEPLAYSEVTLLDNLTKLPVEMKYNLNNDYTGNDGVFNILVEKEGEYQLTVDPLTNHQFIKNPTLSPNWSKIYSDLYSPGLSFFEKTGITTHHDVALQSKGEPYRDAVAEVVPGTLKSENFDKAIVYRGRETFPMAKVCLVEEGTGKIVDKCVNANNIGLFTLSIDKNKVPQKKLILKLKKVDLNDPNLYKNNQKVETLQINSLPSGAGIQDYVFEPILSHIEGYAYDGKGMIMAKANVAVKLKMNDQIFYETTTDDSGFFTIYTNSLPYVEYYLEFTGKDQEKITQTTSEFVKKNEAYIKNEKLDLMKATKNEQSIINPASGKINEIDKNSPSKESLTTKINKSVSTFNFKIVGILLVIFLLFGAVVGMIIYMKKQQTA